MTPYALQNPTLIAVCTSDEVILLKLHIRVFFFFHFLVQNFFFPQLSMPSLEIEDKENENLVFQSACLKTIILHMI